MLDQKFRERVIAFNAQMRKLKAQGYHSGGYNFTTKKTAICTGNQPYCKVVGYINKDLSIEWKKGFEPVKSHTEQFHEKYGWPLKINARGYDAYLIYIQPLTEGRVAPIYSFPGGDSPVSDCELKNADGVTEDAH